MKVRPMRSIQSRTSRQASVLVCVLVCMAIATSLVTSSVRTALDARRAMRTQQQLRQTELLLAAGIQRARLRMQADVDYAGETWDLPEQVISHIESSQVTIAIMPAVEETPRTVRVTARLSIAANMAIQRSYSFSVDP